MFPIAFRVRDESPLGFGVPLVIALGTLNGKSNASGVAFIPQQPGHGIAAERPEKE